MCSYVRTLYIHIVTSHHRIYILMIKISALFHRPVLVGSPAVVELYCEDCSSDLCRHRRRLTTRHPRQACASPNSAIVETYSQNIRTPIHFIILSLQFLSIYIIIVGIVLVTRIGLVNQIFQLIFQSLACREIRAKFLTIVLFR